MPFHSGAPVQCWVKLVHLKPPRGKHIDCLVLFHMHVHFSCAIAWKFCLVNFMALACRLKMGKNVQLQSFLEWMDLQKSKDSPQYLDA